MKLFLHIKIQIHKRGRLRIKPVSLNNKDKKGLLISQIGWVKQLSGGTSI